VDVWQVIANSANPWLALYAFSAWSTFQKNPFYLPKNSYFSNYKYKGFAQSQLNEMLQP
jgi:hypothetical protein